MSPSNSTNIIMFQRGTLTYSQFKATALVHAFITLDLRTETNFGVYGRFTECLRCGLQFFCISAAFPPNAQCADLTRPLKLNLYQ